MEIGEIVNIYEKLKEERRKKGKVAILKNFLLCLKENEIEASIYFLLGKLPSIGYSILKRSTILKTVKPLNIKNVEEIYNYLIKIKKVSKHKKEMAISSLISQFDDRERKFIINSLLGQLRYGVEEGLMLEAISNAWGIKKERIERAYLFSSIPEIVKYARINKIENLKMKLFKPIKPMMADAAKIEDLKGKYAVEYKFDGIRIQIHIGNKIKIFSRNLREITGFLPEIVEDFSSIEKEVILDGEVIAFHKKPLPFQYLMRKFRIKNKIDIPIKTFIFDILFLDGKELIDLEYRKRWEILKDITSNFKNLLPPHITTTKISEIKKFFDDAVKKGYEGIVAKELRSKYRIRKGWYKIKKSYTLDLAIIAAEWGHGRRHRWLSDYWLAVLDRGKFHMVGKTFKGLSDEEFEEITKILLKNKIKEEGRVVFVKPCIVVEVEFDDIQESNRYGLALRFARIKRIRWDKDIKEINSFDDLKKIYRIMKNKRNF